MEKCGRQTRGHPRGICTLWDTLSLTRDALLHDNRIPPILKNKLERKLGLVTFDTLICMLIYTYIDTYKYTYRIIV